MKKRKHRFESVHHFIIGLLLLVKGYDKITHNFVLIGTIIMLLGIFIFCYFFYELRQSFHSLKLKIFVHIFEGIALILTAFIFYEEGKTYLPYVTFIAGLAFFAVVFLLIKREKEIKS